MNCNSLRLTYLLSPSLESIGTYLLSGYCMKPSTGRDGRSPTPAVESTVTASHTWRSLVSRSGMSRFKLELHTPTPWTFVSLIASCNAHCLEKMRCASKIFMHCIVYSIYFGSGAGFKLVIIVLWSAMHIVQLLPCQCVLVVSSVVDPVWWICVCSY